MASSGILVVVLRAGAADRDPDRGPAVVQDLPRAQARWGLELQPLHPGSRDPDAVRYLFASAEGLDDPIEKARSIAEAEDVEAAYFKPPDESPQSSDEKNE